jgi:hypothetical protein
MERHIDEISSAEALRLVKQFTTQPDSAKISSANLAELLRVPEEEVVEKVVALRDAKRRHTFVDRSGAVSAAIAFALFLGFVVARSLYSAPADVSQRVAPLIMSNRSVETSTNAALATTVTATEAEPSSDESPGVITGTPKPEGPTTSWTVDGQGPVTIKP